MNKFSTIRIMSLVFIGSLNPLIAPNAFSQNYYVENVDTTTAFEIGKINVTRYEFEKSLSQFKDSYFNQYGTSPPHDSTEQWKQKYIERYYFVADAYEKGFFNSSAINKKMEDAFRFMLTKEGGIFYNALTEGHIKLDSVSLYDMYKKRKYIYTADLLKFNTSNKDSSILKKIYRLNGSESIDFFKKYICNDPQSKVKCTSLSAKWPFSPYWEISNVIVKLFEGETTVFQKNEKEIYFIHLIKKKSDDKVSFDDFLESDFPDYYKFMKGQRFMNNFADSIMKSSDLMIFQSTVDSMNVILSSQYDRGTPNKNIFSKIYHEKVLNFYIDSTLIEFTVSDFIDFYLKQWIKIPLENREAIRQNIQWMAQEEYYYRLADELGIAKEEKIVLDKKNYLNLLILNSYEENELPLTPITEEEIRNEYLENKESYLEPTKVIVSVFELIDNDQTKSNLDSLYKYLNRHGIENFAASNFDGLVNYALHDTISYDDATLTKQFMIKLKKAPYNIFNPMYEDGRVKVFYREKQIEMKYRPLEEVKNNIMIPIYRRKVAQAKKKILPLLKQKYILKVYDLHYE